MALDNGLHTDMQDRHIPEETVQRARKIWWTVHLLDRQLSSLQGLPLAMRDTDISAELPSFQGSVQNVSILNIHLQLSSILAMIVTSSWSPPSFRRSSTRKALC